MHPLNRQPSSIAARHGKLVCPTASEPGLNNLIQFAGHKGDDLNAIAGDHRYAGAGYGAANQSSDTQIHQPERFDRNPRQRFRVRSQSARTCLDNVNLPRDVENRRNSFVPVCKSRYTAESVFDCSYHLISN
jgi:hypothetical protein